MTRTAGLEAVKLHWWPRTRWMTTVIPNTGRPPWQSGAFTLSPRWNFENTLPVLRLATSLLFCTTVLLTTASQAGTLNVRLILSDSSPPYQQFAASFNKALAAGNADVIVTESQTISDSITDLIVTVGMKAAELAVNQTGAPVVAVRVPRSGYEGILDPGAP